MQAYIKHEIYLALKSRMLYLSKQVQIYTLYQGMTTKEYIRAKKALIRYKKCESAFSALYLQNIDMSNLDPEKLYQNINENL